MCVQEIYETLVHLFIQQSFIKHFLWALICWEYGRKQNKQKSLPSGAWHSIGTKENGGIFLNMQRPFLLTA